MHTGPYRKPRLLIVMHIVQTEFTMKNTIFACFGFMQSLVYA